MQKYKKPKFTEEQLGRNPLIDKLVIPVRHLSMSNQYRREEHDNLLVNNVAELEATAITKVFVSNERRKLYAGLPVRAKELWGWIQYEIDPGKDYIWINRERFMDEVNIGSVNTYKEALKQLIRYCFLTYSVVRDVYWINPDYIFQGNRLRKYPEKVRDIQALEKE